MGLVDHLETILEEANPEETTASHAATELVAPKTSHVTLRLGNARAEVAAATMSSPGTGHNPTAENDASLTPNATLDPCSITTTSRALINAVNVDINTIQALVEPLQAALTNNGPHLEPSQAPPANLVRGPMETPPSNHTRMNHVASRESGPTKGPTFNANFVPPSAPPPPFRASWFHLYWGPHFAMPPPYPGALPVHIPSMGGTHWGNSARSYQPTRRTSKKLATREPCLY